jgi:hypothetical protein
VKALVFRHNLAREAASAIGGRVDPRAFVPEFPFGRPAGLDPPRELRRGGRRARRALRRPRLPAVRHP